MDKHIYDCLDIAERVIAQARERISFAETKMERFNKEAEWLASRLNKNLICCGGISDCCYKHTPKRQYSATCIGCWRDLARKRVIESEDEDD